MRLSPQLTIISILLLTIASLITPAPATASENFDTTLNTTYNVQENGNTRITHEFKITNKKPTIALTKYALKFGSSEIKDLTVTEGKKELQAEVVSLDNQTSVGITFPEKVVGQGKSRKFAISFTNPDTAIVSGQVLEVVVPKLQNKEDFTDFTVSLKTPVRFGTPTRVLPANFTTRVSNTQVTTTFDKINDQSIVALFGRDQLFDMSLKYNLENPHTGPRLTQVALPPDTTFQKMYYRSLDPLPKKMEVDSDGNWIATYLLPANTTTIVNLIAQAHITLEPNQAIPVPQPSQLLTRSQEFWDLNHPIIKETTLGMTEPRHAYNYVVKELDYNYNRLGGSIARLGAVEAIQTPNQALCQEFTDSFVALSRAIGTPSRRITGFAHTENEVLRPLSLVEDILHAWPEYYHSEKKYWVPIDPTWENTSGGINYFDQFDLNHVVFAINGSDSVTPYPAGSYKTPEQTTKDVEVEFGDKLETSELSLSFLSEPKYFLQTYLKLPLVETILVKNNTGQAYYGTQITSIVTDPNIHFSPQDTIQLDTILPYQSKQLPVTVVTNSWLWPKKTAIELRYADQTQTITTTAIPAIWQSQTLPYAIAGMGGFLVFTAIAARSLLVYRQNRQRTLRRQSQKPQE
jgi:hypothetical protein